MTWQPDDIPKEVQEHYEREAERRGLFSSPRFACSATTDRMCECNRELDHDGPHRCRCGREWPNVKGEAR